MMTEAELLRAIEAHLQRTGETATAFGRRVASDGNLVGDLRQGRSPRLRLVQQIMREVAKTAPASAA